MENGTKSKVKSVTGNGTWDSPHGLLYKFDYVMDDNTELNAMHKQNKPFDVGDDVEYIITGTNEYGNRGKVSKPSDGNTSYSGGNNRNNSDYVKGIEVGHAVNNAVNMICAGVDLMPSVEFGSIDDKIKAYATHIMSIANELKQS